MNKRKLLIFTIICTMLTSLIACQKKEELITVRLNEVVHSVFYAPQYVALEKGFFEEEGLKIVMDVGQGADARVT